MRQLRGEVADVAAQVNSAIALCEEHEFVHYLAMALILRGWAKAQQGGFEEGVADIQHGREMLRSNGALLYEILYTRPAGGNLHKKRTLS